MATWQIVIGTVGFGAVLCAAVAWALLTAARLLEDDSHAQATVVRGPWRPQGHASDDGGWGDEGHLRAMRAEQHRRELRARGHAAAKARGHARLTGGQFPAA